jgi:DNA-binding IclR family transcriptional regulator
LVKPALAASRAVRVIDFLAVHPGQPFTLTEMARALGINAASTLAVLAALTEAGYVVRHPVHKTYVLGAALVAVGHAALVQHPALEAAREELAQLSSEIEAQCVASVLMGDELVAVVVEGRARTAATSSRLGTRVPFSAPFGAPFAAYGDDHLRARWMHGRRGAAATGERTRRLDRVLAMVRQRGYAVGRDSETREQLGHALWILADDPGNARLRTEVDRLLDELANGFAEVNLGSGEVIDVAHVTVPVFSAAGDVVMILTGVGFTVPLAGAVVSHVGMRLRASAEVVATRTFGSPGGLGGAKRGQPTVR